MRAMCALAICLLVACGSRNVDPGIFFPTWEPEDVVPDAIVQGRLIEDEGCLYLGSGTQTLVIWEQGMGFEDGSLLDEGGSPIAKVGETIHGGGGYFGGLEHIERIAEESIPERCVPDGDGDRFAIIYRVEAGPSA